jgi:hypothetical protein
MFCHYSQALGYYAHPPSRALAFRTIAGEAGSEFPVPIDDAIAVSIAALYTPDAEVIPVRPKTRPGRHRPSESGFIQLRLSLTTLRMGVPFVLTDSSSSCARLSRVQTGARSLPDALAPACAPCSNAHPW